jgi:RecB family exonuclease
MLKDSWRSAGYVEDGVNEQEYYNKAVKMIQDYYKSFVENVPYKRAYKIEEYFELPIGKKGLMTGYIDKIDELPDGNYEILDYKTEPKWPGEKIMEDHKLQLAIYWWACKEGKITPVPPAALSLWMLQFDKKVTFYPQKFGMPKEDSVIDMDKMMNEIVERIDSTVDEIKSAEFKYKSGSKPDDVFVPKKNDYCSNCDFRHDCPLFLI